MNFICKTFVLKPRENHSSLKWSLLFYMNVCCTVSLSNFPNVIIFTDKTYLTTDVILGII